jgi:hypothetical protein
VVVEGGMGERQRGFMFTWIHYSYRFVDGGIGTLYKYHLFFVYRSILPSSLLLIRFGQTF